MKELNIIDLILAAPFDNGVRFNCLVEEGAIDLKTAISCVLESKKVLAIYNMAGYVKGVPLELLEDAICDADDFDAIIQFAEYIKGANAGKLLNVAEDKVKEAYPEPNDHFRITLLNRIDSARFETLIREYQARGIEGVKENSDLLESIIREEEPNLSQK